MVPAPHELGRGCAFAPRCAFAEARCRVEQPALVVDGARPRRRLLRRRRRAASPSAYRSSPRHERRAPARGREPAQALPLAASRWLGPARPPIQAVDDVSFTVARGETLALVGESGCGKTTTAKSVVRLVEPTSGSVKLEGEELTTLSAERMRQRSARTCRSSSRILTPRSTRAWRRARSSPSRCATSPA